MALAIVAGCDGPGAPLEVPVPRAVWEVSGRCVGVVCEISESKPAVPGTPELPVSVIERTDDHRTFLDQVAWIVADDDGQPGWIVHDQEDGWGFVEAFSEDRQPRLPWIRIADVLELGSTRSLERPAVLVLGDEQIPGILEERPASAGVPQLVLHFDGLPDATAWIDPGGDGGSTVRGIFRGEGSDVLLFGELARAPGAAAPKVTLYPSQRLLPDAAALIRQLAAPCPLETRVIVPVLGDEGELMSFDLDQESFYLPLTLPGGETTRWGSSQTEISIGSREGLGFGFATERARTYLAGLSDPERRRDSIGEIYGTKLTTGNQPLLDAALSGAPAWVEQRGRRTRGRLGTPRFSVGDAPSQCDTLRLTVDGTSPFEATGAIPIHRRGLPGRRWSDFRGEYMLTIGDRTLKIPDAAMSGSIHAAREIQGLTTASGDVGWVAVEVQRDLFAIYPLADAAPPTALAVSRASLEQLRFDEHVSGVISLPGEDILVDLPLTSEVGSALPWGLPATLRVEPPDSYGGSVVARIDVHGPGGDLLLWGTWSGSPDGTRSVRFAAEPAVRDREDAARFLATGCASPPQARFALEGADAELRILGSELEVTTSGGRWRIWLSSIGGTRISRSAAEPLVLGMGSEDRQHRLYLMVPETWWGPTSPDGGRSSGREPRIDRASALWAVVREAPIPCVLDDVPCELVAKEWLDAPECPPLP